MIEVKQKKKKKREKKNEDEPTFVEVPLLNLD